MATSVRRRCPQCRHCQTQDKGHGRVEWRVYYQAALPEKLKRFTEGWPGLTTIGQVISVTEREGKECADVRYYLSSLKPGVKQFARAVIEQDFHDVKEVWGAGQQQVRNIWTNIAVFNLNLWMHTLVECWAWNKPVDQIRNRKPSPWDDPDRRPSHADRRKALQHVILENEYKALSGRHRRSSKIRDLYQWLLQLAA